MHIIPVEEVEKEAPVLRPGVPTSLTGGSMMLREEGIFTSLWQNIKDVFFPQKLPPLVLESKPIAVVDRMKTRQDPRATAASFVIYGLMFLLLAWMLKKHVQFSAPNKTAEITEIAPPPPTAPPKATVMGGGGGQHGPTPVTKGRLPKFADQQITPPAPPPLQQPKIKMPDPTIEVQKDLKMANNTMPNFGMPNSPLVGTSMGNGHGTGIGSGSGSGFGPGTGGNYGGGLRRIGGGVSAPVLIYQVDPEFSEEARKAKFMGIVTIGLIVDAQGRPQNVHVVRGVGMGLDEKAVEAVKQYKFKPAMEAGKPVPVELNVEVNFQIF